VELSLGLSCYEIGPTDADNYTDANIYCAANGGFVVTLSSADEVVSTPQLS